MDKINQTKTGPEGEIPSGMGCTKERLCNTLDLDGIARV